MCIRPQEAGLGNLKRTVESIQHVAFLLCILKNNAENVTIFKAWTPYMAVLPRQRVTFIKGAYVNVRGKCRSI